MSAPTPQQTWPRLLGEIVVLIAMFVGILIGAREGLSLLIPADSCAGTPVGDTAFIMILINWGGIAFPKNKPGFRPLLRLGAVMLAGTLLAYLATRLAAGCTPAGGWDESARHMIEIFVVIAVSAPLAVLHRRVIEPRWSRAMGEAGNEAGEEGGV